MPASDQPRTLARRCARRSASSSPPGAPGSPRSRRSAHLRRTSGAASPGCAARRSHFWQESHRSTTSASNEAMPPASPRASSTASPTPSSSTRPSAPTWSTCSAPQAHPAGPVAARPRPQRLRPTIQRLVDSMHGAPAVVLNGRLEISPPTLSDAPFLTRVRRPRRRPQQRPVRLPRPRAKTFFRDWDTVANDTVAILRAEAGRDPHDRDLSDLVGQLSTRSDDFRLRGPPTTSASTPPASSSSTTPSSATSTCPTSPYPRARLEHQPGRLHPRTGSAAQDALALLASWAASQDSADRSAQR